MKKIIFLLIACVIVLVSSCGESPTTEADESVVFLQSEKETELSSFKNLITANLRDEDLKTPINNLFDQCLNDIKQSNSVLKINQLSEKCINEAYNLIPLANGKFDFTSIDETEKSKILSLLDEYSFRNNLYGIALNKTKSLNLNSTSDKTWKNFFGENGTIYQNKKEEYWNIKPFLSNEYFIKGLSLALNKDLFKAILKEDNGAHSIDLSRYDYFDFDLDKSRSFFKLAINQLVEEKIYDISHLSEPIQLNLEIAWDQWNASNQYESLHNSIKECFETAFNDLSVSNGNFVLNVTAWKGTSFGEVYTRKIYPCLFDISFGKISSSNVDNHPYINYELISSSIEISKGFTTSFSIDTNSLVDCIVYDGQRFSYDAVVSALSTEVVVLDGKITF